MCVFCTFWEKNTRKSSRKYVNNSQLRSFRWCFVVFCFSIDQSKKCYLFAFLCYSTREKHCKLVNVRIWAIRCWNVNVSCDFEWLKLNKIVTFLHCAMCTCSPCNVSYLEGGSLFHSAFSPLLYVYWRIIIRFEWVKRIIHNRQQ